uniref:Uncharacterized protein n=1 Tax=Rhizophora mucronata TaxID=61149 RepID=A0A2P2KA72_RHIMU
MVYHVFEHSLKHLIINCHSYVNSMHTQWNFFHFFNLNDLQGSYFLAIYTVRCCRKLNCNVMFLIVCVPSFSMVRCFLQL